MVRQRSAERESYWRDTISRQRSSGQSIAEFCRRQGISPPSFYAWRRRLAERKSPQFVAVNVAAASSEFQVRLFFYSFAFYVTSPVARRFEVPGVC